VRSIHCGFAEGPKDIARAARLAESRGGQTRAILKLLGRAHCCWRPARSISRYGVRRAVALFGLFLAHRTADQAWLMRKKARRLRQQMAAAGSTGRRVSGVRRLARLVG